MTRHINREKAMFAVYQNQILPRPIEELIRDNFSADEEEDSYMLRVVRNAIENTDRYHGYIDEVLEGWTFDRLGAIEQAILLNGCAEFDLKEVLAAVIIDEYVRLAKKYCDADSYKLINGVLDRI
jgi:N utilization substance protein B